LRVTGSFGERLAGRNPAGIHVGEDARKARGIALRMRYLRRQRRHQRTLARLGGARLQIVEVLHGANCIGIMGSYSLGRDGWPLAMHSCVWRMSPSISAG
jgi:hypothetical protein